MLNWTSSDPISQNNHLYDPDPPTALKILIPSPAPTSSSNYFAVIYLSASARPFPHLKLILRLGVVLLHERLFKFIFPIWPAPLMSPSSPESKMPAPTNPAVRSNANSPALTFASAFAIASPPSNHPWSHPPISYIPLLQS